MRENGTTVILFLGITVALVVFAGVADGSLGVMFSVITGASGIFVGYEVATLIYRRQVREIQEVIDEYRNLQRRNR